MPVAAVDSAAEALLLEHVDAIWAGGWQPTELARQGRIGCATAAAARLVGWAIATDHAGRRSTTLHHRWVAQIDALGLPRVTGRSGWVAPAGRSPRASIEPTRSPSWSTCSQR